MRDSLIRIVEAGSMTFKDDRGVELRLAAYYLLQAMLEKTPDLDVERLVEQISRVGLTDEKPEVLMICFLILIQVAKKNCEIIVKNIDQIIGSISSIY